MVDPLLALLVFGVVVLAVALVLWPGGGLLARIRRFRALSERVRLEDALKHVYMCERTGPHCTLESLAGRLEVSTGGRGDRCSRTWRTWGWCELGGEEPALTDDGRRSALHIVRTHRLWERYLADRTGVPAGEWHDEAERMEHTLTAEERTRSRAGSATPAGIRTATRSRRRRGRSPRSAASVSPQWTRARPSRSSTSRTSRARSTTPCWSTGSRSATRHRGGRALRRQGPPARGRAGARSWTRVAARNVTVRASPARRAGRRTRLRPCSTPGPARRCACCRSRRAARAPSAGGSSISASCAGPRSCRNWSAPPVIRWRTASAGALIALRREQAAWISDRAPRPEREEVA